MDKKGDTNFFTSQMIKDCMKKVTAVNLHQTVQVDDELEIKAYYAGHVLGAAMFHIKVGSQSVVYTVRNQIFVIYIVKLTLNYWRGTTTWHQIAIWDQPGLIGVDPIYLSQNQHTQQQSGTLNGVGKGIS